ncbi:uncharacterized protein LOC119590985 [Penaeus monodon]|uniref:uncharacterized protein LOC119590985 n=1 Tax=Penaeus monodon TaxID=6687 RepID=UPI0018A76F98|nr:uncharacterized protein LOC119590985 [Penaeus monodon]
MGTGALAMEDTADTDTEASGMVATEAMATAGTADMAAVIMAMEVILTAFSASVMGTVATVGLASTEDTGVMDMATVGMDTVTEASVATADSVDMATEARY